MLDEQFMKRCTKQTVFAVSATDFNTLISRHYPVPKDYMHPGFRGGSIYNGKVYELQASKEEFGDQEVWDKEEAPPNMNDEGVEDNLYSILGDLCNKDVILPGTYQITVSW
jgi:hypothetical protein